MIIFKSINKLNKDTVIIYRNYKKNPSKKKDLTNHNKQRRDLYEKANILSIPSGLFGSEIKPQSFYLSSSGYEIIDDKYGNLIINIDGKPSLNIPLLADENDLIAAKSSLNASLSHWKSGKKIKLKLRH